MASFGYILAPFRLLLGSCGLHLGSFSFQFGFLSLRFSVFSRKPAFLGALVRKGASWSHSCDRREFWAGGISKQRMFLIHQTIWGEVREFRIYQERVGKAEQLRLEISNRNAFRYTLRLVITKASFLGGPSGEKLQLEFLLTRAKRVRGGPPNKSIIIF